MSDGSEGVSRRPDVSIVVPCYNAAGFVRDVVESLRRQSLPSWEAMCVDDGSTDGTAEVLQELAREEPRLRIVTIPHGGVSAARNRGVQLSRAERVLFLDADDVLSPGALECLLRAAEGAGPRTVVTGGYELLDRRGGPLGVKFHPSPAHFSVRELLAAVRITVTTLVPRRLLDLRPFDEMLSVHEDWDLWLRLAAGGVGCVVVPEVILGYRMRATSACHRADGQFAAARRMLARWEQAEHCRSHAGSCCRNHHRLAWAFGSIAMVAGDEAAVPRYLRELEPMDYDEALLRDVAGSLRWAFLFGRGAYGQTWRTHRGPWLRTSRRWLEGGPLAHRAGFVLDHLSAITLDPSERLAGIQSWLAARQPQRVVLYGLGSHGRAWLEGLRTAEAAQGWVLAGADDAIGPELFDRLALERVDPRLWRSWPASTVVLVTPEQFEPLRRRLVAAGGREGMDFLVLARRPLDAGVFLSVAATNLGSSLT